MNDDMKLDSILSNRKVPEPASNLSSRITTAAQEKPRISIWEKAGREMGELFLIPRPAYVLVACLVIGLFIGLGVESDAQSAMQDWFSFADIDEGEWL